MQLVAFDNPPVFKKSTLSNGVRVVTEHHPFTRATTAGVFVNLGTRDEPKELTGLAHFIEHIVFKGTQTRNAYELVEALEAVGGEINAYTTREMTCFHATTLREHLDISLDILSDIVVNAECTPTEYDREREVILQEIDMSADLFEEYIFDLYFEESYLGHSLGRNILGSKESLSRISQPQLNHYYQQNYGGINMLVSVVGHVNHERVLEVLEDLIGKKKIHLAPPARSKPEVGKFKKILQRPSEQVHILLGGESSAFDSPLRFEAYILNTLLGGGMTSSLYQKIREEKGWAYSVYSYLHSYTDSGLMMIYAGTSEKNMPKVCQAVLSEVRALKKKGVSQKQLDYFKTQVKGNILLAADDIENRMNSLAVNELIFGRYRPVEEIIQEIEKVNVDSVQNYMDLYFDELSWSAFVLGEVKPESTEQMLNSLF